MNEIISNESTTQEITHEDSNEFSDDPFAELYEKSLKSIRQGELLKGEVVKIGKDCVIVDIGYKSEGYIPLDEFINSDGDLPIKVGESIEVLVEKADEEDGDILLSYDKALKIRMWEKIKRMHQENEYIKGKIVARVKGGMSVDLGGLKAFLPGSHIDLKPVKNFDSWVGTEHSFKILKYNLKNGNIVVSRRAILEEERERKKKRLLDMLKEGLVLEGVVKNITDYGLFIDLGGLDGLVHITDMSWGRVKHPSENYRVGDRIKVKVLHFDRKKERVSLGIKQLTPNPWNRASERYPIGKRVKGKVVSIADYGAFVELEEGIEGLIHISELSWSKKIKHPSQVVKIGDMVETVVLNIEPEKKRISLGLKQVQPNPWDIVSEKYPVGTVIEGRIKNITDFGLFIGIDEGIDGLVHVSDISWTKRINHPADLYRKGQKVQAVVLNIDKENERFSLGIKQLLPDPWESVPERYPVGSRVTGTITNITDFGIFLELEEGIEGLIHISEIPKDSPGNPTSRYNVGDVIDAKVINVSKEKKKIGLSIKRIQEQEEKSEIRSYMQKNKSEVTSNLGEILKRNLINLNVKGKELS